MAVLPHPEVLIRKADHLTAFALPIRIARRTDRKNKRGLSYLCEGSGVRVSSLRSSSATEDGWPGLGPLGGFCSRFARGFALDS